MNENLNKLMARDRARMRGAEASAPSNPTIADAKRLAYAYRKRAVIVLYIGGGQYGTASYGMTRADCDAAARLSDAIFDAIQRGLIQVPEQLTK